MIDRSRIVPNEVHELIEDAVEAERARCTAIYEYYMDLFQNSSDPDVQMVCFRIRNQIANGIEIENVSFQSQLQEFFEEDHFLDDDGADDFCEDTECIYDDEMDEDFPSPEVN